MSEVLYHGTRAGFRGPGGLVLPRAETGAEPTSMHLLGEMPDEASRWVYVTPDQKVAERFALAAQGRGKPKVLVVKPVGEVLPDWATFEGDDEVLFRCKWATVLKVLPVTEVEEE